MIPAMRPGKIEGAAGHPAGIVATIAKLALLVEAVGRAASEMNAPAPCRLGTPVGAENSIVSPEQGLLAATGVDETDARARPLIGRLSESACGVHKPDLAPLADVWGSRPASLRYVLLRRLDHARVAALQLV